MSSPKLYERAVSAAAALIEPGLGRHWVKLLARRMDVPDETARFWLYHRMPQARRAEIADAIIAECDRLEALIAATRSRCEGERNDEGIGALARGGTDEAGAPISAVGEAMRGRAMPPS